MRFRIILANLLLTSVCIAFLVHFAMIKIYGQVLIQEPNTFMWCGEVLMFVGFIIFGIYNLAREK